MALHPFREATVWAMLFLVAGRPACEMERIPNRPMSEGMLMERSEWSRRIAETTHAIIEGPEMHRVREESL